MKTIDLSDLKVGDKAWSPIHGEVEVISNYDIGMYPIQINTKKSVYYTYDVNGLYTQDHPHPTLFHSEQEFREYWGMESNTLTKREQFAMAAMQGLLAAPVVDPITIKELVSDAIDVADFMLTKLNEKQ